MDGTASLLPPRVRACQIRTIFNGWMTCRRFQRVGGCILGCADEEDSINHYAQCLHYNGLWRKFLGLRTPPPHLRLEDFLGIRPWPYSLPEHCRGSAGKNFAAAVRAVSVSALYKTHNAIRHGATTAVAAQFAFRGYIRESVRGHGEAMKLCTMAFSAPLPQ